jgi:hypothetical protein
MSIAREDHERERGARWSGWLRISQLTVRTEPADSLTQSTSAWAAPSTFTVLDDA